MAGAPAAPRRNLGMIIAILVIVGILAAALIGYGVVGYAFASSRISSADSALNSVIDHENAISKTSDDAMTKLSGVNVSSTATVTDLQGARTTADQLVTSSQSALPTVASDDASLASAKDKLDEQQWLTVISRDRLNHEVDRLTHARKALADQKTIMTDYTQLGQFFQSFLDENIDLVTIGTTSDFAGELAAASKLKADAAKALPLAAAPGLPPEVHQYQLDLQTLANDFVTLLNAVVAGDSATANAYVPKIKAEATTVDAHDWAKIGSQVTDFYKPLIDDYNAEGKLATA
jgi:hypothetical protein